MNTSTDHDNYSAEPDRTMSDDAVRFAPVDSNATPGLPFLHESTEHHYQEPSLTEVFGEPIHVYTRAQAIADEALIEVPEDLAREAGFRVPVALTAAAWEDCVAWSEEDNSRKDTVQDEAGRLWDVLWMTRAEIRRHSGGRTMTVELYRVPRDGRGTRPRRTQLLVLSGPGDNGEHVITISLPHED